MTTKKGRPISYGCNVIWQTWDRFWQETSINGVSNAGKARDSALRRVIWTVIFILGLVATSLSANYVLQVGD